MNKILTPSWLKWWRGSKANPERTEGHPRDFNPCSSAYWASLKDGSTQTQWVTGTPLQTRISELENRTELRELKRDARSRHIQPGTKVTQCSWKETNGGNESNRLGYCIVHLLWDASWSPWTLAKGTKVFVLIMAHSYQRHTLGKEPRSGRFASLSAA